MSALPLFMEPRWREGTASHELFCEDEGVHYTPNRDLLVIQLKAVMRMERANLSPEVMNEEFLPLSRLLAIRRGTGQSCLRHALEACIMARAGADFIREKVSADLTDNDIRLFKGWYFDVDENLDRPFWVEQYVFAPADQCKGEARMSNYGWKVVAYSGGLPDLMAGCIRGSHVYTEEALTRRRRRCLEEEERRAFERAVCGPKYATEEVAGAMHSLIINRVALCLTEAAEGGKNMERETAALGSIGKELQLQAPAGILSKTETVTVAPRSANATR